MTDLRKLSGLILDFLFPISCISCKTGGVYLCKACVKQIPRETAIIYSKESPRPYAGGFCGIIPAVSYKNTPLIQQAIHLLKYRRIRALAEPLGEILRDRLEPFIRANQKPWLAVPVPLHPRKLRARGFNQNDSLAEATFKDDAITLATKKHNPLRRIRDTKSQTNLNGRERLMNVKQCFAVANRDMVKDRSIILIDDVITTGATMLSAADALLEAGAREVWGAVVARSL